MTSETRNQIEELIQRDDGTLAKELESIQSKEEFLKVFEKHGILINDEEADEILKEIIPKVETDEIDEDELEHVAGGFSLLKAAKIGWGIGARVGMVARMIYDKYKYNDPYKNYTWKNVVSGKL